MSDSDELIEVGSPEEKELSAKQSELDSLSELLATKELKLSIARFQQRYFAEVGSKYVELDDLLAQLAEAKSRRCPDDTEARETATHARRGLEEIARLESDLERHRKERILIVAGEIMANLLGEMLEEEGFDVYSITNGRPVSREAIFSELANKRYDMILPTNTAMRPPDIEALIPQLRSRYPNIGIIVFSGCDEPDFINALWREGIDDFIKLPFTIEKAVSRIKSVLSKKRAV